MKKLVILIHIIILASLSACKDDCLTCPENEAILNGECQCIGVLFKGECLSLDQALMASTLEKTNIYEPLPAYISEKVDYNSIFDFNNQAMFFYLAVLSKRDQNTVETVCGIRTEGKDKAYLSQLRSPLGELSWDTLRFYAPSAFEYYGFVSNFGEFPGLNRAFVEGVGPILSFKMASLLYALLYAAIIFVPVNLLYRRKIFIKL